MINCARRIPLVALLALIFSALAVPCAAAQEPTARASTQPAVVYRSAALNELVAKSIDAIQADDSQHAQDAIKLFGDLGRADLLAEALAHPHLGRRRTIEFVRTLPLDTQRDVLVRTLANERVFKEEPQNGELTAERFIFLELYRNFARSVVIRTGFDVDEFPFNPDDPAARMALRKRLTQ